MHTQDEAPKRTLGIVDNDILTLTALSSILHDLPWLRILWTTVSGEDALDYCLDPQTRPEVMLVDMSMEHASGATVCRMIRSHALPVGLVCMTSFSLASYAVLAAQAGAQALVSKTDLKGLSMAVRRAATGLATPCHDGDKARFADMAAIIRPTSGAKDDEGNGGSSVDMTPDACAIEHIHLSAREAEIIRMYAEGLETDEIARSLSLSKFTVGTYVKRIVAKLHARNRIHAMAICQKRGLI